MVHLARLAYANAVAIGIDLTEAEKSNFLHNGGKEFSIERHDRDIRSSLLRHQASKSVNMNRQENSLHNRSEVKIEHDV